jgi:hypothetical protein
MRCVTRGRGARVVKRGRPKLVAGKKRELLALRLSREDAKRGSQSGRPRRQATRTRPPSARSAPLEVAEEFWLPSAVAREMLDV